MLAKLSFIVFFVILVHFNQPILGEDDLIYHKPECEETKPLFTETEIEDQCSFWDNIILADYCADTFRNKTIEIKVCCEGFKRIDDDRCVLECKPNCKHGECDENDRCSCAIGFGSRWCDVACPAGHFGPKCEHNCECLTSRECNPNYQHCRCDKGSITAECENICKCRFNLCNPGRIGKNCSVPCPDGSYGQFCSRTCSCVDENTRKCVKESGDCVCKDRFYGLHCERECTGVLKCDKANVCMCELSREQKAELVVQTKNNLIVGLIVGLVCLSALLLIASFMVYRYKIKSRRLKKENYSLRYSSDGCKVALNNPIYSTNLLDDGTLPLTHPNANQFTKTTGFLDALKSNRLFNRMNSMSKDWLKPKNDKPSNLEALNNDSKQPKGEEDEMAYSTINELIEVAKNDNPAV